MTRTRTLLALAASLAVASLAGCLPVGRTVSTSWNETACFLDVPTLCVQLNNVETEGNCDFTVIARRDGVDTMVSTHTRINRGSRVPVSFSGANYEIEVYSTTEHVFESDEAGFVLHGPN